MSKTLFSSAAALGLLSALLGCGSDSNPRDDGGLLDGGSLNDDDSMMDGGRLHDGGSLHDGDGLKDGAVLQGETPIDLGTAHRFVILAKSGVSSGPASDVTGSIGVSPAAATALTGFSLTEDASKVFATSAQITGMVYAANYGAPTPSDLTTAIGDMETAFTNAAGRAPGKTEIGAGNIGSMTLDPGVYKWGTGVLVPTDLTLNGSATDVWIFQIAKDLTMNSGAQVHLTGGARPENVFWQVAGLVSLGTTAHCEGVILSKTAITLQTGSSVHGRLLAQTRVNLQGSTVVEPTD